MPNGPKACRCYSSVEALVNLIVDSNAGMGCTVTVAVAVQSDLCMEKPTVHRFSVTLSRIGDRGSATALPATNAAFSSLGWLSSEGKQGRKGETAAGIFLLRLELELDLCARISWIPWHNSTCPLADPLSCLFLRSVGVGVRICRLSDCHTRLTRCHDSSSYAH